MPGPQLPLRTETANPRKERSPVRRIVSSRTASAGASPPPYFRAEIAAREAGGTDAKTGTGKTSKGKRTLPRQHVTGYKNVFSQASSKNVRRRPPAPFAIGKSSGTGSDLPLRIRPAPQGKAVRPSPRHNAKAGCPVRDIPFLRIRRTVSFPSSAGAGTICRSVRRCGG